MRVQVVMLVGLAALAGVPGAGVAAPGLLVGERQQVTSRVCFYEAALEPFSITVPLASVCPPSFDPDSGGLQSDRSAINAQIARGFGPEIRDVFSSVQRSRDRQQELNNQQRLADLEAERMSLENEKLRRDLAAAEQRAEAAPEVACYFPPAATSKHAVPILIKVRRVADGLEIMAGAWWEPSPSSYDGERVTIAGPPIKRIGARVDAPADTSTLIITGNDVVLVPQADVETKYSGTCF